MSDPRITDEISDFALDVTPENHLRNAVINTNPPSPLYLSQHSLQQSNRDTFIQRMWVYITAYCHSCTSSNTIARGELNNVCCTRNMWNIQDIYTRFHSINEVIRPLRNAQTNMQICHVNI